MRTNNKTNATYKTTYRRVLEFEHIKLVDSPRWASVQVQAVERRGQARVQRDAAHVLVVDVITLQ